MSLRSILKSVRDRAKVAQRMDPFFPHVLGRLDELNRLQSVEIRQTALEQKMALLQQALGRIESRQVASNGEFDIAQSEFRVFSQWGEDGIIQSLLNHVKVPDETFVEFGVEDYEESNTRFLLVNNNWKGLVLDSSAANIERVRNSPVTLCYNLTAAEAFITPENINELLVEHGFTGEIGLLSIDIDGNDYWVWRAIEVIEPAIVAVEYNHRFGPKAAVTIPYTPDFDRSSAHPSRTYFGASLKALCLLAQQKGYAFVGCNSNGVNAFFVRRDLMPPTVRELSAEDGFVGAQFGEARYENGRLVRLSPEEEVRLVSTLPVTNVADDVVGFRKR